MGYRHQLISDTMIPTKESLPEWFTSKYESHIDFDRDYWASYSEFKRGGTLKDLEIDVQKLMKEINCGGQIRLVFFADESGPDNPDLTHVTITDSAIIEIRAIGWDIFL